MFKSETNLVKIREATALLFDVVTIEETPFLPGLHVCSHPFTTSTVVVDSKTGEAMDLTTRDGYSWFREAIMKVINRADLAQLYFHIGTPWKMTWFKMCNKYMGVEDYAKYLSCCWQEEENPNQDNNVSQRLAVKYFRNAQKKYLMEPADFEYYNSLPNTITVYRGVSPGRAYIGLSWTDDKSKAQWFKERFESNGEEGVLLTAIIPKDGVLAYLNSRNERELVVDTSKLRNIQEE